MKLLPIQDNATHAQMISHINHNFNEIEKTLTDLQKQISALRRN